MTRTNEEARELFDRWAANYDTSVRADGGPLDGYEQSLAQAASLLRLLPGARVLDIGIGTGAFASLLAERGAAVWGLDISTKMLERCQAAHPDFGLALGSFTPIPHEAQSFDAVVASFAFHEVAPAVRAEALAEVARVLKPGGYVGLLDIMFASPRAMAEARDFLGEHWDDTEEYPLVGELDALLRAAGCSGIVWRQTAPCHWAVVARCVGER